MLRYKDYYHAITKTDHGLDIDVNKCNNTCNHHSYIDCSSCDCKDGCFGKSFVKDTLNEFKKHHFTWKDIVQVNGKLYEEEFMISGLMDDKNTYQIDDFLEAVAKKYDVSPKDIKTYTMDNIPLNSTEIILAGDCGCYIDGTPEWCID